ncbi:hypothetical protein [Streptomyces rimosus]
MLSFHGLCLVQIAHDPDWYMGDLNDDGSFHCWSVCDDFSEAWRGL